MRDADCVELLVWLLPRLGLDWLGFRRVRRQVCKRLGRRLEELGLPDGRAYRAYLERHPEEWVVADACCTVTISTFNRDPEVFAFLGSVVLPELAQGALARGATELNAWSAGCASGEEPYTLALLWDFVLAERFPDLGLRVLGTDVDSHLLERARTARYEGTTLRHLPPEWLERAFVLEHGLYRLKAEHQRRVAFARHDLRRGPVGGPFELIACRNMAFTYFGPEEQRAAAVTLRSSLREGGALVLGRGEKLPPATPGFSVWSEARLTYRAGDLREALVSPPSVRCGRA